MMRLLLVILVTTALVAVDGFITTTTTNRLPQQQQRSTKQQVHLLYAFGAFGNNNNNNKKKASPLLDEALNAYPFQFQPEKAVDPTLYAAVTQSQATTTFNELARLYGDDEALTMVKVQPNILTFNSKYFAPCLDAWTDQFGLESAQAMVRRNPGLLGVNPILAKEPAEASMALSYVVAVTRPLPKLIGVGLLLAIATAGLR